LGRPTSLQPVLLLLQQEIAEFTPKPDPKDNLKKAIENTIGKPLNN
jgi:hypothetical protein